MTGAAAHIQHSLISEPISSQEAETRVLLHTHTSTAAAVETVVTIVTAVVAILVPELVLHWWLGGALGGATPEDQRSHDQTVTPSLTHHDVSRTCPL